MRRLLYPILLLILFGSIGCQQTDYTAVADEATRVAGELRDKKLYEAAIEEYRRVLDIPGLNANRRGSVSFLIAEIYFNNLKDYSQAAAWYVRARELSPESPQADATSRNLVAALEKSGRLLDARLELDQSTDIDAGPAGADDRPVAKIGNETVYQSEIQRHIQALPPEMQKKLLTRDSRIEFVHQYVGRELLYRAAVRERFNEDPEIVRRQEELGRQLVIDRFVAQKVMPELKIDTADVRNFYLANKTSRYDDAPYDSVRARVYLDYQNEKASATFNEYIGKLADAEHVEVLEPNIQ